MLSISIQVIFATGRLLGGDCHGAFLLDGSETGAIDLDCAESTVSVETNHGLVGGNVSVRVGGHTYEGCSVPYTAGHDASGVFLSVYCPAPEATKRRR